MAFIFYDFHPTKAFTITYQRSKDGLGPVKAASSADTFQRAFKKGTVVIRIKNFEDRAAGK